MNAPAPVALDVPRRARPGRFGDPAVSRGAAHTLVPVTLAALAILPHLVPPLAEALQYDRAALAAGQAWRWLTCHWTHWSADHLFWDLATFLVLGVACARRSLRAFLATLALSAVLIPAAVWAALPHLTTYRGLSGLDSALLALLVVGVLRDALRPGGRRVVACACLGILVGFGGKLLYEVTCGETFFVNADAAGFVPVPLAHAVGAWVGGVVALRRGV